MVAELKQRTIPRLSCSRLSCLEPKIGVVPSARCGSMKQGRLQPLRRRPTWLAFADWPDRKLSGSVCQQRSTHDATRPSGSNVPERIEMARKSNALSLLILVLAAGAVCGATQAGAMPGVRDDQIYYRKYRGVDEVPDAARPSNDGEKGRSEGRPQTPQGAVGSSPRSARDRAPANSGTSGAGRDRGDDRFNGRGD